MFSEICDFLLLFSLTFPFRVTLLNKIQYTLPYFQVQNDQSRTLYSHIPTSNLQQRTLERRKQSKTLDLLSYDINKDTLYVSKCICLLSQVNFVNCFKEYLEQLHRSICATESPVLAMECFVYNILYEVPCPLPGKSMKFTGCLGTQLYCQRPGEYI